MQRILHLRLRALVLILTVGLLASGVLAFGQGTAASLTGVVTDASGAAVQGASVKIVNIDTNFTQSAKTDGIGVYLLRPLPIGHYKLEIVAKGFDTYLQAGIELTANLSATQNVSLRVGAGRTETVAVTADAELVNTTSAELGTTVGEAAIAELPLNGRDPSSLVLLAPGTSNVIQHGGEGIQTGFSFATETGASSNGGRQGSSFYMLDGVSNMDNYNLLTAPFPNSDATQEFKVISNNFSAQYGFSPGAVVSIATKSGTNKYHGGAFWFVRNNDLNAGDWFSHAVDTLKRNQFGAYVGGPIKKDKLFFFGNYQGTKMVYGATNLRTSTPTTAMLNGDFSGISSTLTGPFHTVNGVANQLDTSIASFSSAAVTMAKTGMVRSDTAQSADGTMFYTQPPTRDTYHEGTMKLDYNISPSQTLSLRSFTDYMTAPSTDVKGNMESVYNHSAWTASFWEEMYYFNNVLSHNWTINPTTVNSISVFWNQQSAHNGAQELDSNGDAMCFSRYIAVNEPSGSCYMGALRIYSSYSMESGWDEPSQEVRNTLGLVDTLSKSLGRHSISAGVDVMHQHAAENTQYPTQPTIVFKGNITGNALSDYLLGYAQEYMQGAGEIADVAGWQIGPFVQDDYRIKPNLTLNLGLRWDPNTPPTSRGARGAAFVAGQQSSVFPNAPTGLIFPGDKGMDDKLMPASYGYWESRVGVAYQPTAMPHSVIHAGFGLFTGPLEYSTYNHAADIAPYSPTYDFWGWADSSDSDVVFTSPIKFDAPWTSAGSPLSSSPFPTTYPWASTSYKPSSSYVFSSGTKVSQSFARNFKLGMTQSWNVSLEQQLDPVTVIRMAYVGSQSYHLSVAIDRNTEVNWVKPYSSFSNILEDQSLATASYHSLQLGFERKMSKGLQVQSNFTWSHSIDLASSSNVSYGSPYLANPFSMKWNRGNSNMDMPWNWVSNFLYHLPELGNQNKLMKNVLGGWQVSGIITAQTGNPFSVMSGANNSGTNLWMDRADSVAGVSTNIGKGSRSDWATKGKGYFNAAAFTNGASFGDTGRNAYWGPKVFTMDAGLMKSWDLAEGTKLQFRWEAFNVTNHPNFGTPDTSQWSSSNTGVISGLGNVPPRVMQGALKLTF